MKLRPIFFKQTKIFLQGIVLGVLPQISSFQVLHLSLTFLTMDICNLRYGVITFIVNI